MRMNEVLGNINAPMGHTLHGVAAFSGRFVVETGETGGAESRTPLSAAAAVSESAFAALRVVERLHGLPFGHFVAGDHELRDAFAVGHGEGLGGEVDQDNADFAPVVGVDRAGRVEQGDAVLEGQAGARTHLGLVALRQGDAQAGGHQAALHGLEHDALVEVGTEVKPGALRGGVGGQRVVGMVDDAYFHMSGWMLGGSGFGAGPCLPSMQKY